VARGFTVLALAKVLEQPKPVTSLPDLKMLIEENQIPFENGVKVANAEWYILEDDEVFSYQLQKGISKVNVPEIRNRAFRIWNDRFINYWIFQCNPEKFDLSTSIQKNLLQNWIVAAHKNSIKIGDKAIIWCTGKSAGCYALATVMSNPEMFDDIAGKELWKMETESRLRVKIADILLQNWYENINIRSFFYSGKPGRGITRKIELCYFINNSY
jgi:hypothetical protein